MPDVIDNGDIGQIFNNTVVMYKGTPVYFDCLVDDGIVRIQTFDGDVRDVKFILEDFKAPPRVGFVNHARGCSYVTRVPVRMFKTGLHNENTNFQGVGKNIKTHRCELVSEGVFKALTNNYPSLYAAWKKVNELTYGAVAFDKQFAIDPDRNIWFKDEIAGSIPKGFVRKSCIQWNPGFEFCAILLEPNYEETKSTFEPA